MKNLVIIGNSRSGKTTLANMVAKKYKFNIVSMDAMVYAFDQNLPQLGIRHLRELRSPNCYELLVPFVASYANWLLEYSLADTNIIVEGSWAKPRHASEIFSKEKFKIVALGYPDISPEQMFNEIRKKDKPNSWTKTLTDDKLLVRCKESIEKSKVLKKDCEDLGIEFINTSFDRTEKLNKFLDSLPTFLA